MRWSDFLKGLPDDEQMQVVNTLTVGIIQLEHAVRLHGQGGTTARLLGALGLVHASFAEVVRLLGGEPDLIGEATPDHPGRAADWSAPYDLALHRSPVDALGRAVQGARRAAEGMLADGDTGACVAWLQCALDALQEIRSILMHTGTPGRR